MHGSILSGRRWDARREAREEVALAATCGRSLPATCQRRARERQQTLPPRKLIALHHTFTTSLGRFRTHFHSRNHKIKATLMIPISP